MDLNQISIGFNIAALLLCLADICFSVLAGRMGKKQNRYFMLILAILMINSVTGIIGRGIDTGLRLTSDNAFEVYRITRFIYYFTHSALCPLFYWYVSSVIDVTFSVKGTLKSRKGTDKLNLFLFIASEAVVIVNPFTHLTWYYDSSREFHRGPLEMVIYICAAVSFVITFDLLIRSWNVLTRRDKYMMVFSFALALLGILIQLVYPLCRAEVLFEALGFTGVMTVIENEDERMNVETGCYNRAALRLDVAGCIRNRRHFSVVFVRLHDPGLVQRLTGSQSGDLLNREIVRYLLTKVPSYSIYLANPSTFALLVYDEFAGNIHGESPERWAEEFSGHIRERFDSPWKVGDAEIPVSVTVICASVPKNAQSEEDLFYIADSPFPANTENGLICGEGLSLFTRRMSVETAVSKGLERGSFEVYYQPTYNLDKSLHGAEALLRMHDPLLGDLYPDEFIPVAESLGLIDEIDEFVLCEVCRYVATGKPGELGLDSINVNLSVLQCMKEGFADHIDRLVGTFGIDRHFINFEITESVAANDYDLLRNVIKGLKEKGFLFSIDDFGTGYSNLSSLFSLGVDVIKIDKSILWGAEESRQGYILLENCVRMMKELGYRVLIEGVETASQIEILTKMGADYLQGYYFSKPLPVDRFNELLS